MVTSMCIKETFCLKETFIMNMTQLPYYVTTVNLQFNVTICLRALRLL